jgi:O-antigen/teichoic acid export membrane protein
MSEDLRHLAVAQWRARLRAARARGGGTFIQPVMTLVTGAVAAQAITFAGRPVLTRLFTPEEFGVLTLFTTLTVLFGVVGTGRFEDAMMLPARRADAARLLALALGVALATAVVLAAAVIPWREALSRWLESPSLSPSLVLLPAAGLAAAWGLALETWHTRLGRFRRISAGRVAQSVVAVGTQVTAGVLGASAVGLTAGATAGMAVLALVVAAPLTRRDGGILRVALRARGLTRGLAHRYRRFPTFAAPAALLNTLSGRIPVFGLAVVFGAGPTGLYGLAFGTLALPVGVVTSAVGQVFFAHAAPAHRAGTLAPLTRQVHRRLALMAAFPMAAAALAGPEAFALVFGPAWEEAGIYARLLAPWLLLSAIVPPLTRVFDVTERQRADLFFSVLQAAGLTAALAGAAVTGEARVAVGAAGAAGTLLRLAQNAWLLRLAGVPLRHGAADLVRPLVISAPFLGAAWLAGAATRSSLVLVAALAVAGLGYYTVAARTERTPSPEVPPRPAA